MSISVIFLMISSVFQKIFIFPLLQKTRNRSAHSIYAMCMIQELLVLIEALTIGSLYQHFILYNQQNH